MTCRHPSRAPGRGIKPGVSQRADVARLYQTALRRVHDVSDASRRDSAVLRHAATVLAACLALLTAGCASTPPRGQGDLCGVFEQRPDWYDYARASERRWGTPISVLMAFVRHESSYRSDARPAREWFWFIPLGRPSSAQGYAQAQDPVWGEYTEERGSLFRSRSDMEDALDFIGWYNDKTHRQLGIRRDDAYRLYLAYHEGRGGYRRGTWKEKPAVQATASRVSDTATRYRRQLARCESRFRCDAWYQVWPFCS